MYRLLKKTIYMCTLLCTTTCSTFALANEFTIIDFNFSLRTPSFDDRNTILGANINGTSPWGTLVEGTYQGTSTTNDLVDFNFFGSTVNVYTALTNTVSTNTIGGSVPGGPTPTINLTNLSADMSSWFAEWSGTAFNQGNNSNFTDCFSHPLSGAEHPNASLLSPTATVKNNLDGTFVITWNSCISSEPPYSSFVGQVGFWELTVNCDSCPASILGASETLSASQAGNTTRTIEGTGGNVVIISELGASPAGYTFTWLSETDNTITDLDANQGSFTFDPSGLTPGNYVFSSVSNIASSNTNSRGKIIIKVVASSAGFDINDDNNNGIINQEDDASLSTNQLQTELSNGTAFVINSDKGNLILGESAFCASKAAKAAQTDIAAFAGTNCTPITNASDDASLINAGIGGYYDFEIHGLALGDTAQVVIPLSNALPAHAVYRKFNNSGNTWSSFISDSIDSIKSATATSNGICPSPGSSSYTTGLTKGDNCIQLTITDGGFNDADGVVNGHIVDPGAIAEIKSGTEANLASGCSISGKPSSLSKHSEWLLLFAALAWLGLSTRTRKQ